MSHRQLILMSFLSLFGTAAYAQSAAMASTGATADAASAAATGSVSRTDSSRCLSETGSAIKPTTGNCMAVNGRSYSREDMDRTGATTLGGALSNLSITNR